MVQDAFSESANSAFVESVNSVRGPSAPYPMTLWRVPLGGRVLPSSEFAGPDLICDGTNLWVSGICKVDPDDLSLIWRSGLGGRFTRMGSSLRLAAHYLGTTTTLDANGQDEHINANDGKLCQWATEGAMAIEASIDLVAGFKVMALPVGTPRFSVFFRVTDGSTYIVPAPYDDPGLLAACAEGLYYGSIVRDTYQSLCSTGPTVAPANVFSLTGVTDPNNLWDCTKRSQVLWTFNTGGKRVMSMTLGAGGLIVVGNRSASASVWCLDPDSGALRWSWDSGGDIIGLSRSSPGHLYVCGQRTNTWIGNDEHLPRSRNDGVYRSLWQLDPATGKVLWSWDAGTNCAAVDGVEELCWVTGAASTTWEATG